MKSYFTAVATLIAAPCGAQVYVAPPPAFPAAPNPDFTQGEYRRNLHELRNVAVMQQRADGGKLSLKSIAILRARYALLEKSHKRQLRKTDRAEINMLDHSW